MRWLIVQTSIALKRGFVRVDIESKQGAQRPNLLEYIMPATFFQTADIEFAIPGYFRIEVRYFESDTGDRTEAKLLSPEGTLITSTNLPGQCATLAITPLLDTKHYPHGEDNALKAARMAAMFVNNI